jgi:hypothetical protein
MRARIIPAEPPAFTIPAGSWIVQCVRRISQRPGEEASVYFQHRQTRGKMQEKSTFLTRLAFPAIRKLSN